MHTDGNSVARTVAEPERCLNQISLLFGRDKSVISRHIKNIFQEEELSHEATVANFASVQTEGGRQIERQIEYFNLDMILSVGYRVNSIRGTQFRIWANRILKEHLVQGYTINEKRLLEQRQQIQKLQKSIALAERTVQEHITDIEGARAIINLLSDFAHGLQILDDYDHENLEENGKTQKSAVIIKKEDFLAVVESTRRDFDSAVFNPSGVSRLERFKFRRSHGHKHSASCPIP